MLCEYIKNIHKALLLLIEWLALGNALVQLLELKTELVFF